MSSNILLYNKNPLVVNPELAEIIGLNEAIILQQLHYWLQKATFEYENKKWVYNSLEQWREQFKFFSESTIKRVFNSLKKRGLIEVKKLSKESFNKTNYYTIHYNKLTDLIEETNLNQSSRPDCTNRTGQNEPIEEVNLTLSKVSDFLGDKAVEPIEQVKMNQSKRSDCSNRAGQFDLIEETNLNQSSRPDCTDRTDQNEPIEKFRLNRSLIGNTETTTEITTETTLSKRESSNYQEFKKFVDYLRSFNGFSFAIKGKLGYDKNHKGFFITDSGLLYSLHTDKLVSKDEAHKIWEYLFSKNKEVYRLIEKWKKNKWSIKNAS